MSPDQISLFTKRLSEQATAIRDHMQKGKTITHKDAETLFGCQRLAARIFEIKQQGWDVQSRMVRLDGGVRYKMYWL